MRKWLKFEDLYVNQKVMVQSGVDHPCCVICGTQDTDQGSDVHAATVVDLNNGFGSVVIQFDSLKEYIIGGLSKAVDRWSIHPGHISNCLFINTTATAQTICSCDIHYLMNVGCPSTSGKVCPNLEAGV